MNSSNARLASEKDADGVSSGEPRIQILAHAQTAAGVTLQLRRDPIGVLEVPALPSAIVSVHVGTPARLSCRQNNLWRSGTAVHGDIDILAAHTPGRWVMHDENDLSFLVSLPHQFLASLVDTGKTLDLRGRFQVRDPVIENLCWTMKREIEEGGISGALYLEGLSLALASRLIAQHSSIAGRPSSPRGLSKSSLKAVLDFIEEEIAGDLALAKVAEIAGVGLTQVKTLFARSTGVPVHRYVIQRRVERARALLGKNSLSIDQVAAACGFSHPSHMNRHLRESTGMSARSLKRWFQESRTTE